MRLLLVSFGGGLLAGVLYALIGVRSPAPPIVALLGLLGMLLGEQAVPLVRRLVAGRAVGTAYLRDECAPHLLAALPPAPRHDAAVPGEHAARPEAVP